MVEAVAMIQHIRCFLPIRDRVTITKLLGLQFNVNIMQIYTRTVDSTVDLVSLYSIIENTEEHKKLNDINILMETVMSQ